MYVRKGKSASPECSQTAGGQILSLPVCRSARECRSLTRSRCYAHPHPAAARTMWAIDTRRPLSAAHERWLVCPPQEGANGVAATVITMSACAADEFESWAILSALLCPAPPPPPHPTRPATPSETPVAPASGGRSELYQPATLAHLHQLIRTLRSLSATTATPTPRAPWSFGRHQPQALLAAGSSPGADLTGFGFGSMPHTPRHVGSGVASAQAGASFGAAVSDGLHAAHAAEAVQAEARPQLSREAALAQLRPAHAQTTASASASPTGGSEASLDGALSTAPGVGPEGRMVLS